MIAAVVVAVLVFGLQQSHAAPSVKSSTVDVTTLNCLSDVDAVPTISILKMNDRSFQHMGLDGPTSRSQAVTTQPIGVAPGVYRFSLEVPPGNYEIYASTKWCAGQVMTVLLAGRERATSIALTQDMSFNMLFDHDHVSIAGEIPIPGSTVSAHRADDPGFVESADQQGGAFYLDSLQRVRWILDVHTGCCSIAEFGLDLNDASAGDYVVANLTADDVVKREAYTGPMFSEAAWIAPFRESGLAYSNSGKNTIGWISAAGIVREAPVPSGAQPGEVAVADDGTTWFTESGTPRVGFVDTNGRFTEVDLHDDAGLPESWGPHALVVDHNGDAWTAEPIGGSVDLITKTGELHQFDASTITNRIPGLALDGNGSVWFRPDDPKLIARVTADGLRTYPIAQSIRLVDHQGGVGRYLYYALDDGELQTDEIAGGDDKGATVVESGRFVSLSSDGHDGVWYADCRHDALLHVVGKSELTKAVLGGSLCPWHVVPDLNGGAWFASPISNVIDHVTSTGDVSQCVVPGSFSLGRLVLTSDNTVWFIEHGANKIGFLRNGEFGSINLGGPDAESNFTLIP